MQFSPDACMVPVNPAKSRGFFLTGLVQTIFAEPEKIKLKKSVKIVLSTKPAKLATCNRSLVVRLKSLLKMWDMIKPDLVRITRTVLVTGDTPAIQSQILGNFSYFSIAVSKFHQLSSLRQHKTNYQGYKWYFAQI